MTETLGAAAAAEVIAGDPHRTLEQAEHDGVCANCDVTLEGPYCHACGQRAHLHSRLRDLFHEALEGIVHFDGRLWRTLPLLALNPGRLSREWREGRRVRYVQPLHLFLFALFLFFTLPMFTGEHLINLPSADQVRMEEGGADPIRTVEERIETGGAGITVNGSTVQGRRIGEAIRHRLENPEFYSYKIESLAYKLSFLIAPFSMLILGLLMLFKRGFTFYDHGVVSLYGIGFAVLVLTLFNGWGWLIGQFGLAYAWPANLALVVALQAHAIGHLRGAYRLSWFGAIARGLLLSALTTTAFGLLLLGVVALGLLT